MPERVVEQEGDPYEKTLHDEKGSLPCVGLCLFRCRRRFILSARGNLCFPHRNGGGNLFSELDGLALTVYVSDDKVSRGNSVLLWVESNGHGCTPYHWQVTGKGFHFDSASGPTTAVTAGDGEPAYIWADTTACGAGLITVTDGCGGRVEASFRVPDAGKWVFLSRQVCGEIAEPGVRGHCCERCSRIAVGAYRYTDCWVGGPYPCRYKSQTCSKWPYTEDLSELCYHVGYHPCFSLQGLYDHNLEIFQCADQ